jgi:predicted  nucleic acid-binding Zn-ribbon protein
MTKPDRTPGPSRWQCPQCAFDLYTRMSPLDDAAHRVHHRQAHHHDARLRSVPLSRSEIDDYVSDLEAYIYELVEHQRDMTTPLSRQIVDLEEQLGACRRDLAELGSEMEYWRDRVEELEEQLDAINSP